MKDIPMISAVLANIPEKHHIDLLEDLDNLVNKFPGFDGTIAPVSKDRPMDEVFHILLRKMQELMKKYKFGYNETPVMITHGMYFNASVIEWMWYDYFIESTPQRPVLRILINYTISVGPKYLCVNLKPIWMLMQREKRLAELILQVYAVLHYKFRLLLPHQDHDAHILFKKGGKYPLGYKECLEYIQKNRNASLFKIRDELRELKCEHKTGDRIVDITINFVNTLITLEGFNYHRCTRTLGSEGNEKEADRYCMIRWSANLPGHVRYTDRNTNREASTTDLWRYMENIPVARPIAQKMWNGRFAIKDAHLLATFQHNINHYHEFFASNGVVKFLMKATNGNYSI